MTRTKADPADTPEATMIGRRVRYEADGAMPVVGIVLAVEPTTLIDVETGARIAGSRFALRTDDGRLVWTHGMSPAAPGARGA